MLSDGQRTYTWMHGRQLQSVTAGNATWTNCYDENGIRTDRYKSDCYYQYNYEGGKLKFMNANGAIMYFTYDFNGAPLSVNYNGTEYYYVTNLQGDVVAILNAAGTAVVTYTYDAWGNPLTQTGTMSSTLGTHNPLRYRGYVYDTETNLYYLLSRYYDPQIGRFINADIFTSTGQGLNGTNMFAYCLNNPIMYSDSNGYAPSWWQWTISGAMFIAGVTLVATGVGGIAGGMLICASTNSIIGSYVSESAGGSSVAGWSGGLIAGTISGMGAGLAANMLIQASGTVGAACLGNLLGSGAVAYGSGAAGSALGQVVSGTIDGKKLDAEEIAISSMKAGTINCLNAIGTGIGTAIQGMPAISTTTTILANSLNLGCTLVTEAVCDFLGTMPERSIWEIAHLRR